MKDWLKYFKMWFIICGGIILVLAIAAILGRNSGKDKEVERVNLVCTETERVFDYADVLTPEEEDSLRELIAEREKQTRCDIVLVTMNESLEDYAKQYDSSAYGSDWAMIKADNFYDEYGFGWNKYQESDDGDGVLLLDNWYRESDGKVHTWLSTSGRAMNIYSSEMISNLLDQVYNYIETSPYEAYKAYVNTFYEDMTGEIIIPWFMVFIIPTIVAILFICVNMSGKEGRKTTKASTYVEGSGANFKVRSDQFIGRTVTQRQIPQSSGSSGGGGAHVSAGGHSHGGGGHSR